MLSKSWTFDNYKIIMNTDSYYFVNFIITNTNTTQKYESLNYESELIIPIKNFLEIAKKSMDREEHNKLTIRENLDSSITLNFISQFDEYSGVSQPINAKKSKNKIASMESRIESMENRMTLIDGIIQSNIENRMATIENRMLALESRMCVSELRYSQFESKISEIENKLGVK